VNGAVVDVREFGATGNGVTDDITNIIAAVNAAAAAGGGTVFFPAGTYAVSAAIPMKNNVSYVGAGWASVIKSIGQDNVLGEASPTAAVVNVTIRDLQINGNKGAVTAQGDDALQNGIRWNQVGYSRIINVYVHDTVFNGISIYNASDDNIVAWNRIENVGRPGAIGTQTGIFLEFGADRNRVICNRISTTLQYGIWESDGGAAVYDNLIEGNFINGATGDGIRVGDDAVSSSITGTKIKANTIEGLVGSGSVGIRVFHTGLGIVSNVCIEANTVAGNPDDGIYVDGINVVQTIITGNHVHDNHGGGIIVDGVDTIVADNVSVGNGLQYSDTGVRTIAHGNILDTSGKYNVLPPASMSGGLAIGNGTNIVSHLSATTTWAPPSVGNGTAGSTTVTVGGAAIGDTVLVGFSRSVPGGALLVGAVTSPNTVTVTLFNMTGSSVQLASGTLRADVWQH